jgi:hypothetical protein
MTRAFKHDCVRFYAWTMAALKTGVARKADLVMLQGPP